MINTKTNRNLITFIVLTLFLLDVKLMICVYCAVVKQKCTIANVVIYADTSFFYSQKFFC